MWIARGVVAAVGCWWVFLSMAICVDVIRERTSGDLRVAGWIVTAKAVPGALLVAFALTFSQSLAVLAASIAIGVWVVGSILEHFGVRVGASPDSQG
jgi:hypothetical protein